MPSLWKTAQKGIAVKNPPANVGDIGLWMGSDPWVRNISWRKKWQPMPVFLPGKFHGQRSLVGVHGDAESQA